MLSKNLQRINEQNRVKDQQLKVMRSILMHQKNQIMALTQNLGGNAASTTFNQQQLLQVEAAAANSTISQQLTGMMDSLNVNTQ